MKRWAATRRTDAMDHVFGYTIINDVTARTLQHKHKHFAKSVIFRADYRL